MDKKEVEKLLENLYNDIDKNCTSYWIGTCAEGCCGDSAVLLDDVKEKFDKFKNNLN